MRKRVLALVTLALAPVALLAGPVEEKGFVFASVANAQLRAEPLETAASTAQPPIGVRLVYKKVVRTGDSVQWYFVDQPGLGAGWLASADASKVRPVPPPQLRPIVRITPNPAATPAPATATTKVAHTTATRGGDNLKKLYSRGSSTARGLSARALEARGLATAEQADEVVQEAAIDYTTLERRIGVQMHDPPHDDGRYANLTARGRKADAEAFAKLVQEGD